MLKGKGIITDFQKEILFSFSKVADSEHFYLTGTALAEFYFGHRLSYDLDFFTSKKELILPFSRVFEEDFKKNGFLVNIVRRFQTFVEFELAKGNNIIKANWFIILPLDSLKQ
ncbi:MAG: nucleotidyl transferase AbiEii/AbiGii toxin family protein [Candidatus Omnitrophica bacterium]|nr:nucleotidyl transferase AbiEii/AbiGii toxin family protein [Candidatus Omnitrophota bacterium]